MWLEYWISWHFVQNSNTVLLYSDDDETFHGDVLETLQEGDADLIARFQVGDRCLVICCCRGVLVVDPDDDTALCEFFFICSRGTGRSMRAWPTAS